MPNIPDIQNELRSAGLDAWLFCDFHHRDGIGERVLGLNPNAMSTRRWFYLIPNRGTPRKLVHCIESSALDSLPGQKLLYASNEELHKQLKRVVGSAKQVAMQYSPLNAIPYISLVDGGTIELVRAQGCKVRSSADLVQKFEACWTSEQYAAHLAAGEVVHRVTQEAFRRASSSLGGKSKPLSEYDLQQWILDRFAAAAVIADEPPIVAVGPHSGDPHYEPRPKGSSRIRAGDLLLLDVWGKLSRPGGVYYDITWIGYLGARVPEKYARIFAVVREARDGAIAFVQAGLASGRRVQGWQVDQAARGVIVRGGYGKYFVHRTGHNIGQQVHGNGANMDGLETHDVRAIIPRTCFSIEPGIYLRDFGIRSEVNVYVAGAKAVVTGPIQSEILPLLT